MTQLAEAILSHFPANYRKRPYVELTGARSGVWFTKDRSTLEIFNDYDNAAWTLLNEMSIAPAWPLLKRSLTGDWSGVEEMTERVKWDRIADVCRAWIWQCGWEGPTDWWDTREALEVVRVAFENSALEWLDPVECARKYDCTDAFFFAWLGNDMADDDHQRLLETAVSLQGDAVLASRRPITELAGFFTRHSATHQMWVACNFE